VHEECGDPFAGAAARRSPAVETNAELAMEFPLEAHCEFAVGAPFQGVEPGLTGKGKAPIEPASEG
jgi:hypothetical protein